MKRMLYGQGDLGVAMPFTKGSIMARFMFAAVAGAMMVAAPALANEPVRPSAAAVTLQPAALQGGARIGAQTDSKKRSGITSAGTGGILAGLVAVGLGVGIATSSGGHHSTSP